MPQLKISNFPHVKNNSRRAVCSQFSVFPSTDFAPHSATKTTLIILTLFAEKMKTGHPSGKNEIFRRSLFRSGGYRTAFFWRRDFCQFPLQLSSARIIPTVANSTNRCSRFDSMQPPSAL